jgi:hypothetical protein
MLFVTSLFDLCSWYFAEEGLEESGELKIKGQVIRTVKCADDLVLPAKEETIPQIMIDGLVEVERRRGMKMNVENLR